MTTVGKVADNLLAAEDGGHHRQIVDLAGSHPRVVGDQHIAGLERVGRVSL